MDEAIDIAALAEAARNNGIDTPDRVAAGLRGIIVHNTNYLKYRQAHGRTGAYNEQVAQDNEILAMAVLYLEDRQAASIIERFNASVVPPPEKRRKGVVRKKKRRETGKNDGSHDGND